MLVPAMVSTTLVPSLITSAPRRSLLRLVISAILVTLTLACLSIYCTRLPEIHVAKSRSSGDNGDTGGPARTKIPHRLHQMYSTELVPKDYTRLVKTWLRNQPSWEYWFWDDYDISRMISDHYPEYISMYNSYRYALQRADAARYFILHRYGGVYADMDFESLRPLDGYLTNKTCVLVPEPEEQSLLLYNRWQIVTNSIMAAAPRHRFIMAVIQALPQALSHNSDNGNSAILKTTGPSFIQDVYERYTREHDECYDKAAVCHVHLSPHEELVPTTDQAQIYEFTKKCTKKRQTLSLEQIEACETLGELGYALTDTSRAYTVHHWQHFGYESMAKERAQLEVERLWKATIGVTINRYIKNVL